jgi:cephalosporin hydroxylase
MFDRAAFEKDRIHNRAGQSANQNLQKQALEAFEAADRANYPYQFNWMGMPIIQAPEDIVMVQEILWENKPDIIIETGIAWGGSVVFYAAMCALMGRGRVFAIDKVLPQKNRDAIGAYPFSDRITLFEGSSLDHDIFEAIRAQIKPSDNVMVLLDSNHTHEHVYEELKMWAPLVSKGQYCVVSDTIVEDIAPQAHRPRPWGPGNNPKTAVQAYLQETDRFSLHNPYHEKALFSCTKDGYLLCVQ